MLPNEMLAGDSCSVEGPFSTTSHSPLPKSSDLSFIFPCCHLFKVPSLMLFVLDSLSHVTPDSDPEPRTMKLECAVGSLVCYHGVVSSPATVMGGLCKKSKV